MPSQPELLDYLALRFRQQHRWSFKSFLKELLLTRTWQLSAQSDAKALAVDPDNRLLGRAHRRRQDAEALHDALRFVCGRLDLEPAAYTVLETSRGPATRAPRSTWPFRRRRCARLYLRLYARRPGAAERERALRFVAAFADQLQKTSTAPADASRAAWIRLCHTLLIANEFLVVE